MTDKTLREAFDAALKDAPEFAPEFEKHRAWAEAFAWFVVRDVAAALASPEQAEPPDFGGGTIDSRWYITRDTPPAFIEYVSRNYHGEVIFHDPAWHAKRLYRAALTATQPAAPVGVTVQVQLDPASGEYLAVDHAAPTAPAPATAQAENLADDLCVKVGYSKALHGWCVYEEIAPGEFSVVKGPFATRQEADAAMRDPKATTAAATAPATDAGREREQFEAWLRTGDEFEPCWLLRRDMEGSARFGDYCQNSIEWQWRAWSARAKATPPLPQGEKAEPLFLLHCGQIDSSGEQDEWETEADSGKRVDEFASLHPGQTIGLYPFAPPPPAAQPVALSDEQIEGALDQAIEHPDAYERAAFIKGVRHCQRLLGIPRPDGEKGAA